MGEINKNARATGQVIIGFQPPCWKCVVLALASASAFFKSGRECHTPPFFRQGGLARSFAVIDPPEMHQARQMPGLMWAISYGRLPMKII
jgi:hypothetical protein